MEDIMRKYGIEDIRASVPTARFDSEMDEVPDDELIDLFFSEVENNEDLSEEEMKMHKNEIAKQLFIRAMCETGDIAKNIEPFQKRIERVVDMLQKDRVINKPGECAAAGAFRGASPVVTCDIPSFVYLISKMGDSSKLANRLTRVNVELNHYVRAVWLAVASEEHPVPDGRTYNFRNFFYPLENNMDRAIRTQRIAVLLAALDDYEKLSERPSRGKAAEARAIKNGEEALEKQRKAYEQKIEALLKEQESKKRAALQDAAEKAEKRKNELNRLIKDQDRELYELRKENEMMRAQLELVNWPGVLATARSITSQNTQIEREELEKTEIAAETEPDETLPELPSKNVVFVGGAPNTQKKLRQIFPDWDFVGSEGITSSYTMSTKPDVMFLWTKYMAHGMLQSVEARIEAPRVYLKRTNIDAMIEEMRSGYKKVLEGQNIVS